MVRVAAFFISFGCIALTIVPINNLSNAIPILFGVLLILPLVIEDILKNRGIPKYYKICLLLIVSPVILKSICVPNTQNIEAVAIYTFLILLFFSSRYIGPKLLFVFPVVAILESIAIIIIRLPDPHPSDGGLMGIAHFSCFVIMLGLVLAPSKLKILLYILGPSAILITGSEEGILFLFVGLSALAIQHKFDRYFIIGLTSIILTLSIIVPNGHFSETHYKLTTERLENIGNATNHRSTGISDNIGLSWVLGNGWNWDTNGGRNQAIHNAVLNIANQYGVISAAGFFMLLISPVLAIRNRKYLGVTVILLSGAAVDHFLLTYFIVWPYFITGAMSYKYSATKK